MADWSADSPGILTENQTITNGKSIGSWNTNQLQRENSVSSSMTSTSSKSGGVLLDDGNILAEESRTEHIFQKKGNKDIAPSIPIRRPTTQLKPPPITLTAADSTTEEEIVIPNDGCLYAFTASEMSVFFKHLKIDDRTINYMLKKGITGKKFSTLKDSELDYLGLNNPLVVFFREKSKRKKASFML